MANPDPAPASVTPPPDASRGEPHEDLALAELLRADAHAAAPRLYDRFSRDVNRWVWRLLGADADHHDVVQQVFVRVLRSAKRLRDPERLAAWVYAITVNTVYGELRRREVRRAFLRTSEPTRAHADFVREVEVRDLFLRAKELIEKLPAKERLVFMLHQVEGHTLAQVAEVAGYSEATAKRRLASANKRFNTLLARRPELGRLLNELKDDS